MDTPESREELTGGHDEAGWTRTTYSKEAEEVRKGGKVDEARNLSPPKWKSRSLDKGSKKQNEEDEERERINLS